MEQIELGNFYNVPGGKTEWSALPKAKYVLQTLFVYTRCSCY